MATILTLPVLRLSLIDLRDQGSLGIVDLSTYQTLPSNSDITFQIQPPGWPQLSVDFDPGKTNVYSCSDLGIICPTPDCCPLPDGIYTVTYQVRYTPAPGCGVPGQAVEVIKKTFIKVDQLDCRIANLFLKIDQECDCPTEAQKKYKQQYKEVCLLRDGAVAASNDCDDLLAWKLYAQADRQIDKIYSQFCSSCSPIPSCEQCN